MLQSESPLFSAMPALPVSCRQAANISRDGAGKEQKFWYLQVLQETTNFSFQLNSFDVLDTYTPLDRKAFYSILSLFIEKSTIPSDVIVSIDNYESFMSEQKIACINKLKEYVFLYVLSLRFSYLTHHSLRVLNYEC